MYLVSSAFLSGRACHAFLVQRQCMTNPQRANICHEIILLQNWQSRHNQMQWYMMTPICECDPPVWKTAGCFNSAINTTGSKTWLGPFCLRLCKNQPFGKGDYTHFTSLSGQEKTLFLCFTTSQYEWLKQHLIACKHSLISLQRGNPDDS